MTSPTDRAQGAGPFTADSMIPPVNPFLGLIPKKYWPRTKQFFTYTISYFTGSPNQAQQLAANAAGQAGSTSIQADADFLLIAMAGLVISVDNVTPVAVPNVLVSILDSGSSQGLSDFPTRWENTFGTAQNPLFLPFPRVFQSNATLTTNLTNQSATARNVYMSFIGFKIYKEIPAD